MAAATQSFKSLGDQHDSLPDDHRFKNAWKSE